MNKKMDEAIERKERQRAQSQSSLAREDSSR